MLNRCAILFFIMFPSAAIAWEDTFIQCRSDFFKISDPEEPSFFSDGDLGNTKLYSIKVSTTEPPELEEIYLNEGLYFSMRPTESWIEKEGIVMAEASDDENNPFYSHPWDEIWKGYIDRMEGEAWFLAKSSLCISGCRKEQFSYYSGYSLHDRPHFINYSKAFKYSDCSKVNKSDIRKKLLLPEIEKREKAKIKEREIKAQRKF